MIKQNSELHSLISSDFVYVSISERNAVTITSYAAVLLALFKNVVDGISQFGEHF